MTSDPYRIWLGIPKGVKNPNYYHILGIAQGESNEDVIRSAIEQRRFYIQSKRGQGNDAAAKQILDLIEEAAATLLVPEFKHGYDRQMGIHLKGRRRTKAMLLPPWMESRIVRVYGEGSGLFAEVLGIVAILFGAFALMAWFSFQLPWQKIPKDDEAVADATPLERIFGNGKAESEKKIDDFEEQAKRIDSKTESNTKDMLKARLSNTTWVNSNGVSFEWTADGRLRHNGKNQFEWNPLGERRLEVMFSSEHKDILEFNSSFTEFKQLVRGGQETFTGKLASNPKANILEKTAKTQSSIDPFRQSSVWGEGGLKMVVMERTDGTFRAKIETREWSRIVSGTIQGANVTWLAKDVQPIKGGTGGDNFGVISNDGVGFKMDVQWKQPNGKSGTQTYRLMPPNDSFENLASQSSQSQGGSIPKPVLYLSGESIPTNVKMIRQDGDFVAGKIGNAVAFNGKQMSELEAPLPTGNSPRSLACWIKNNRGPIEDKIHVITYGRRENNKTFGIAETSGKWRFFDLNGGLDSEQAVDKSWHHHAVTYDGNLITYYFDSSKVASTEKVLSTERGSLVIGGISGQSEFVGIVDELYFFDSALSADHVRSLFQLKDAK